MFFFFELTVVFLSMTDEYVNPFEDIMILVNSVYTDNLNEYVNPFDEYVLTFTVLQWLPWKVMLVIFDWMIM